MKLGTCTECGTTNTLLDFKSVCSECSVPHRVTSLSTKSKADEAARTTKLAKQRDVRRIRRKIAAQKRMEFA